MPNPRQSWIVVVVLWSRRESANVLGKKTRGVAQGLALLLNSFLQQCRVITVTIRIDSRLQMLNAIVDIFASTMHGLVQTIFQTNIHGIQRLPFWCSTSTTIPSKHGPSTCGRLGRTSAAVGSKQVLKQLKICGPLL